MRWVAVEHDPATAGEVVAEVVDLDDGSGELLAVARTPEEGGELGVAGAAGADAGGGALVAEADNYAVGVLVCESGEVGGE